MNYSTLTLQTAGERFYQVTEEISQELQKILSKSPNQDGILFITVPHTSCALAIQESYDPSAAKDLESFLRHMAPRTASFITHTAEGEDDSPSHMKSLVLPQSLTIIVDQGKMILGTWQGIYLCEFRDSPKQRQIHLKFLSA